MDSTEKQSKGFSFGFSKTKQSKKLTDSVIKDEVKEDIEETDYVTSLEDRAVKSVKPVAEEVKSFVIPLIKQNKWCIPKPEDLEQSQDAASVTSRKEMTFKHTGDEITDRAVEELVSESRRELEHLEGRDEENVNRAIPLLLRNKVPEGFETDDKLDVQLRPDEAAEADYDHVPIEHFGMAMLRGMGFKEGEGMGKHKKSVVPIDAVARPKGLGLGADRSLTLQKAGEKSSGKGNEEDLVMKRGSFCVVQAGKHNGMYATVEGIDEDNARVVIKLTLGGTVVTLNQMAVNLVTMKEYDKCSKYINKAKVDQYKEKEEKRKKSKKSRGEDDSDSGSRHHRSEKNDHRDAREHSESRDSKRHKSKHHKDDKHYKHDSKRSDSDSKRHGSDSEKYRDSLEYSDGDAGVRNDKHSGRNGTKKSHSNAEKDKRERNRSRSPHRQDKKSKHREKDSRSKKSLNGSSRDSRWLHPQLRVRIIDPESKYYKSKVIIEDVVSLDSCICKSDDGRIMEGVSQAELETVIPKSEYAFVMIVAGKYKGQVGEVLGRNKSQCTASIQLLPDRDEILNLDYDVICEYAGNTQDFE